MVRSNNKKLFRLQRLKTFRMILKLEKSIDSVESHTVVGYEVCHTDRSVIVLIAQNPIVLESSLYMNENTPNFSGNYIYLQ